MSEIEYSLKCDAIVEWAENKKGKPFDTTFVVSISDHIKNMGFISQKQMDSIDNILTKFKIPFEN